MNYRHGFHAGNFADVHKHVFLVTLLDHLRRKDAPFCYIDTHAGRGLYDLTGPQASRSEEWRSGVGRLLLDTSAVHVPEIARYVEALRGLGVTGPAPRSYPGSPLIARALLRPGDRAVCIEREPGEAAALRSVLGGRKHTSVLCVDGYQQLKGEVPPRERRGLVLVDPPYESPTEFADLARAMTQAYERWPTGIYAAWYPIKAGEPATSLLEDIAASGLRKVLRCELAVRRRDAVPGLNGSGLLIVNPPWRLDERGRQMHADLLASLAEDRAGSETLDWLVAE